MGICCVMLGTQPSALWQPRGWDTEGGSGGRGHMYLCGCFLLMYGRSYPLLGKFKKTTEKDKVKNKQSSIKLMLTIYSQDI